MQIRKKGMKHVEYLVNNTPVTRSSATDNPSGQLYKIVEPMLKTKWNQTSPYNLYVPKCPPEYDFGYGYDGRHPAGCTIIAWAQVLAYLQPNINDITTPEGQKFYWGNLGSYSPIFWGYHELTEEDKRLASLIKNLADGSGTKFTSEGGSVSVDAVANYVKKWNVHIDGKNSCTFQNMANSLNSRRPVICRGTARAIRGTRATGAFTNGSHAWVVDGYQIRVRPSNVAPSPKQPRRILKRYNVYCHANMGWGGSFDGWYLYRYDGSIDFGFLSWNPDHPFKFITMSRDPLYIITSKDFVLPQAYHGIFPASIFEDYPFIYSESGMDRDDISLFLQKQKSKITKNFTCRDDYTIIKMVERNLGIALLADLVINCHNGNINKFPTYPSAFRTLGIGLLSERNLSLAAKTFIKIAKKIVQEITPDNIL